MKSLIDKATAYAYPYGRISGMHQKLLSVRDFETFSRARSVGEIVASLEGTEYEAELQNISTHGASDVESALMVHFTRVYNDIVSLIPSEDRILLNTLILGESDLKNLKAILRGIHASLPSDDIQKLLLPFGNIKFEKLCELSKSKDIETFLSKIDEPYSSVLKDIPDEEKRNLLLIEIPLDNLAISQWLDVALNEDIREYISLRIDILNIANIIRCRVADIPSERYLLSGGTFSEKQLKELSSVNLSGILNLLDSTPYGKIVRDAIAYYEDTGSLLQLEQKLSGFISKKVEEWSMTKPLSIYSIMSFIDYKLREIKNLRTIVTTKEQDFDPERIKSLLIE